MLTFISGGLLLAALTTYLTSPEAGLKNILLIIASIIAGFPIMIKAFQALRMKVFSIDLLVTIAVAGAMIIGEYTESAVVTFLFLFGNYLEGRTLQKARSSLKSLLNMAPLEATVLRDSRQETIPADEVEVGDLVFIHPGGKIPVDGRVVSGNALVNEAAITGESVPVTKNTGDPVFGGTISDNGYLEVVAEKVGEDTSFSKIIELVEDAQESKAKTQKFLEKFAAYYTPAIVILAVIVWLITTDIHLALTFLVIACPGALVISAPVSLVAGIGNSARNGILIKGGDKMEQLAKVNAVVFDKTGTLTKGNPSVTDIKAFGIPVDELLTIAAEVEVASEHHLGRAIVQKAQKSGIRLKNKPQNVEIHKGLGISAEIGSQNVFIGSKKGTLQNQVPLEPALDSYLLSQEKKGNTVVLVSVENKVLGLISIADPIREEALASLSQLRNDGVNHMVMLTGDNKNVAKKVSGQLGIDQVFAELLPEDKVNKVNACKGSGIYLAMVGDGVNDAPAIASADVGIAMGGAGTDVAIETADVILMSDNLEKLPYAIRLAKATVRNMKQNMYFSLLTVFFLLAGVLTKNIFLASGMLIHELSVLLVILNAIRLVRFPGHQWRLPFKNLGGKVDLKFQYSTPKELRHPGCAV